MERFGITAGGQLLELCRFGGIGVVLGVVYDLFRLTRLLTKPPARRIFLQDILYFALAAAITQVLALPVSHGRVRVFHLLALAAGAAAYYLTAGRLIFWLAQHLVAAVERLLGAIAARLPRPTGKYREKVRKTAKKVWIFLKNRLQPPHNI